MLKYNLQKGFGFTDDDDEIDRLRKFEEWLEGFEKKVKALFPTDQRFHEIYDMAFELMADHEQARKQVLKFINDMWKTKKEILGDEKKEEG